MNEKDIIRKYFNKRFDDSSIIEGIGDDAAIVQASKGCELVITTDTMVEGKHFSIQAPAYAIGYKLMASNVSDIAAMGATPRWATLNLTLNTLNQTWLEEFSNGLFKCAQLHNIALIGGDTTSGKCKNFSIQLIGEVPQGKSMLRHGAEVDDALFVTGVIGNAANALEYLRKHEFNHEELSEEQFSALYTPQSRVEFAIELRELANAAIDISDGLLNELEIICHESNLGAVLQLDSIPVNNDINKMQAITGGEDYELLFTIPESMINSLNLLAQKYNCPISKIGHITNTKTIELFYEDEIVQYPEFSGYDHFAE